MARPFQDGPLGWARLRFGSLRSPSLRLAQPRSDLQKRCYTSYKTSATGAGLGHLAELKRLHSLCVLEDQIDDVWAQNARCISTLRDLQLNVRSMTDKGLADLASLNELVALHLHEMDRTTDEGLSRLSALKNLKFLTVSGSRVTDHSLEVLSKIPSLYSLWLENTSVTDEGMRKFQQRFPKRHVSR